MSRIQLHFPEKIAFTTQVAITISDINYGGHLGNDRFLTLMQEARLQWLKSLGYKDEKVIEPPVGIIVADAAIQFKAEAFHGDAIRIELSIAEVGGSSFDLYYRLSNQQVVEVALGKTGVVCFNYETRKVARISERLMAAF